MSEELKKKLIDYEENPPEKLWARITAALDEEVIASFPQKLYNAQATPSDGVWNKISAAISDDSPEYANKLHELEINPPSGAWQKISSALEAPVVSIGKAKRIVPAVRYALAACLIAALAIGAYKILNNSTGNVVATTNVAPKSASSQNSTAKVDSNSVKQVQPSNNLPVPEATIANDGLAMTKRKTTQQLGYIAQAIAPALASSNSTLDCNFEEAVLHGDVPGDCSVISESEPYFMFMNPDGYLIRISKKLAQKLGCVYTNGNSNDYQKCQSQIKKWSDKIAQSPSEPTMGNFMDILNIIRANN